MAKVAILLPDKEICELCSAHIKDYPNLTPIRIEPITVYDAQARVEELNGTDCDLIIARGLQASLMSSCTQIPIINITITVQELGMMLLRMKRQLNVPHPKIALVTSRNFLDDISCVDALFDVELARYHFEDDITGSRITSHDVLVKQAIRDGCMAVFGGDISCESARRNNIPYLLFKSSEEGICNALSVADRMGAAIDLQRQRAAELKTMLDFTFSGILQINASGIIVQSNRVVNSLFRLQPSQLLGHHVRDILPKLQESDLDNVLVRGEEIYSLLVPIEDQAVVVNIAPILSENQVHGAILTFQESHRIIEADSRLRGALYQNGYVSGCHFGQLPAGDPETKKFYERAGRYARFSAPVLITGEHGNGNQLLAQCIHNASLVASNAFIEADCAAFDPNVLDVLLFGSPSGSSDSGTGLAEAAQNGTLYLSHIDMLSSVLQYKVLQLLCGRLYRNDLSHPISSNVRIIASTSASLVALVEQGKFRRDLYYRLNVMPLELAPLRQRRDDILPWADMYMKDAQNRHKRYFDLTQGARSYLYSYDWPGNLDQLRNLCERTVLTAEHRSIDEVFLRRELEQMAPHIESGSGQLVLIKDPQALRLADILKKHHGSRQAAADELGISTTTLWRRMKKYGISQDFSC